MSTHPKSHKAATYRFSELGAWLLDRLAQHYGLTRTAYLEMALREQGRRLGLLEDTPAPPGLPDPADDPEGIRG